MTLPQGAAGMFTGEDTIFSPGCSNTSKAHEHGHKVLGHQIGTMPVSQLVSDEIDAEAYAFEAMDRKVTARVGMPAANCLVQDYHFEPHKATVLVAAGLKSKGIPFTDNDYKFYRSRLG